MMMLVVMMVMVKKKMMMRMSDVRNHGNRGAVGSEVHGTHHHLLTHSKACI